MLIPIKGILKNVLIFYIWIILGIYLFFIFQIAAKNLHFVTITLHPDLLHFNVVQFKKTSELSLGIVGRIVANVDFMIRPGAAGKHSYFNKKYWRYNLPTSVSFKGKTYFQDDIV